MNNLPTEIQEMVDDMLGDWTVENRREMIECAFANLEQLWKLAPALASNPIYALTIVQFRSVLDEER